VGFGLRLFGLFNTVTADEPIRDDHEVGEMAGVENRYLATSRSFSA
jgi:hypothetical protein